MLDDLDKTKSDIRKISDIVSLVPEALQPMCFEMLLKHYLTSLVVSPQSPPATRGTPAPATIAQQSGVPAALPPPDGQPPPKTQEDIATPDIHVKARRFMDKYSITLTHLNNLFYKEADELQPLYEDLKTTRLAEAQIRIVLLQALKRGLTTGDFVAEIDTVRSECRDRKSYDQGNFAANFKNNKTLFDGEYSKDTTRIGLSEEGRAELAEIIKELQ